VSPGSIARRRSQFHWQAGTLDRPGQFAVGASIGHEQLDRIQRQTFSKVSKSNFE